MPGPLRRHPARHATDRPRVRRRGALLALFGVLLVAAAALPPPAAAAPWTGRDFPARYDLRKLGRVSSVGLQDRLRHLLGLRRGRVARVQPAPRDPSRSLGEPPGRLRRVAPHLRRARPEHHLHRLRRALGGARARAGRPVPASGRLPRRAAGRPARAGGALPAAALERARERGRQMGGHAVRRRGRLNGLRGVGLQPRDQLVQLTLHGRRPPRLRGGLGRRVPGRAVPAPPARPRGVSDQEQLGQVLRAGRLLLGLLPRPLVRDDVRGVQRVRERAQPRRHLPARRPGLVAEHRVRRARRAGSRRGTRAAATAA